MGKHILSLEKETNIQAHGAQVFLIKIKFKEDFAKAYCN